MAASSTVELRPADEGDVPALIRLLRRSWLVAWAPELPFEAVQAFAAMDPARPHAEAAWRDAMVAIRGEGGMLVGMVQTTDDVVDALHVDPACWNDGVGTRLLDAAERRIARAHPMARLEVRHFNTRARTFYERRGWVETRRYAGTECGSPVETIEMRKILRT